MTPEYLKFMNPVGATPEYLRFITALSATVLPILMDTTVDVNLYVSSSKTFVVITKQNVLPIQLEWNVETGIILYDSEQLYWEHADPDSDKVDAFICTLQEELDEIYTVIP